jgi:protein-S-isoprenylcysteine O-methyltransferase Ste14
LIDNDVDAITQSTNVLAGLFVWLGGLAFVLSLAVCAYAYEVLWGRPADWSGVGSVLADITLFVLFAAHHSLFARPAAQAAVQRLVPAALTRSVYVWIASGLLALVVLAWQRVGGTMYAVTGWSAAPLIAIRLLGVWLIARAVGAIDALELAGIRPAASGGALQTGGVYGWVRHPLYFGWVLALFAVPRMTGDRALFAAISTAYLVVAIPWEERALARAFGDAYVNYCRIVRWRLLPFVY